MDGEWIKDEEADSFEECVSERKEPYYKPVAIKYGRRNEVRAHEGKEKRWRGDITSQAKKKKKKEPS